MILLLLVVGLIYIVLLARALRRPALLQVAIVPVALAVGLAAGSIVILVVYLHAFPQWRQPVEVAWTGLHVAHDGSLQIGGERQGAAIGWPTGSFWPQVKVTADTANSAQVAVRGGGGFIKDGLGNYLNGTGLSLYHPVSRGNFSIVLGSNIYVGRNLEILDGSGNKVASIPILPVLSGITRGIEAILYTPPDRVLPLDLMLVEIEVNLRSRHQAATAAKLEDWSAGMRILETGGGEFRLLVPESEETKGGIEMPSTLTVLWPNHTIRVEFTRDVATGSLAAEFAAPWRMSSPLPPGIQQDENDRVLTLTAHALPGDRAFILPFGGRLSDFRGDLRIDKSVNTGCAPPPTKELDSYARQPRPPTGRWQGVTCEQSVQAGDYGLDFKAVRDVPSVNLITVALIIGLLCFAFSIHQCMQRMRPKDRWILCGFGLSIWLLFLLRCHFALRYALDPRFLDPLAVGGVTYAMILLAVGPGAILMAAPLWRDQYLVDASKRLAAKNLLLNAMVLSIAVFAQAFLVRSLWPNLPTSYSLLGTVKGTAFLVVAVLGGLPLCANIAETLSYL